VKWLSDATLTHLCRVADWPDLTGSRYELIDKIGQGGMGAVFLVRDRELDRLVAMKVVHPSLVDAQTSQRMQSEARILARIEHPGIVPIHDLGVLPEGRFYYAMKLIRGKRLDQHVSPAMALTERLGLFAKICDTVAFAHAHGVIHRDLKPQNIMVGAFGEVLILDWGVAKEVTPPHPPADSPHPPAPSPTEGRGGEKQREEIHNFNPLSPPLPPWERGLGGEGKVAGGEGKSPGDDGRDAMSIPHTQPGTILGTLGYMSPEQARGETEYTDERADVHALGGILYFLLTGRDPTHGPPLDQAATSVTPSPVIPRQYDRSIPRSLEAICLKALAFDRNDRYSSVAELSADVADFLAGRRVRAYPEGILEAAVRLGTKYRTVLALLLAYVVMRILFLLFSSAP
jgi:serine/threonine protein kinase